jgi:predicted ATPase
LGRLFAKAAACGVQIIVESHSDHFLNGVRIAVKEKTISHELVKLSFFDRDLTTESHDVRVHNPKVDSNGKLSGVVPGFFDEYQKSLYELL